MAINEDSNVLMLHRLLAVIFDIAVVFLFILIGKQEHSATYTFKDYVHIAIPFLFTFFTVQIILGKSQRDWKWSLVASTISVPLAILLRMVTPPVVGHESYGFKIVFLLVAWAFLSIMWALWRFLLDKALSGKQKSSTDK